MYRIYKEFSVTCLLKWNDIHLIWSYFHPNFYIVHRDCIQDYRKRNINFVVCFDMQIFIKLSIKLKRDILTLQLYN